jgi:hypothetical protein
MSLKYGLALAASAMAAATSVAHAGSLECQDNIISPGITEAQLLEACGDPTSRSGADWTYKRPGSLPVVVTLGNGVVMFIRDADEVTGNPESPLGDPP